MMYRLPAIVAILVALSAGAVLPSVAQAEYIRVEFSAGAVSRLPSSFEELMQRVGRGPIQPYSSQTPTFSPALHRNHGGEVGSVSFSDAGDYCDLYWYELPNATVAQEFLDEYLLSYSGYGVASMPFGERRDNIVIVVVSGSYGTLYQQIVQTLTGSSR
jgi:hypothetical protein